MSVDAVKVGRTVRLSPEINQRLVELCAHLGVNPNAYLVGEIGKAVSRDEISFRASRNSDDMLRLVEKAMAEG
jgi:hypothetical protein